MVLVRHFFRQLLDGGLPWLARAVHNRIIPERLALTPLALAAVAGRHGLEIGGPSRVFARRKLLPVYAHAARIDNVNFSDRTAWETGLRDGGDFHFQSGCAPGTQWICEATSLAGLADGSFDFVLSSHCLEHLANPLAALREWHRVTREGGHLLLLVPDPANSFDHRRPRTTLAHLRADAANHVREDDQTHVAEILALHDLARDPYAGTRAQFEERSRHNTQNRCLHHHVFDLDLLQAALADTGWTVLGATRARPVHLVALARRKSNREMASPEASACA